MKVFNHADIQALDKDDCIDSFMGKPVNCAQRSTGVGEHGPWSFENLQVMMPTGEKIDVKLKDRDPFPQELMNRDLMFSCWVGDKGKKGLKAGVHYKDAKKRIVIVTKTGNIEPVGSEGYQPDAQPEAPPAKPQTKATVQQAKQAPRNPEPELPRQTEHEAPSPDKHIAQLSSLHFACLRAANYEGQCLYHLTNGEVGISSEDITSIAATLFIQTMRECPSLANNMRLPDLKALMAKNKNHQQ